VERTQPINLCDQSAELYWQSALKSTRSKSGWPVMSQPLCIKRIAGTEKQFDSLSVYSAE